MTSSRAGALRHIPTKRVRRNEHNPRLIFRPEELEELAASIGDIGVQVPISVFRNGRWFVLIDGERRWRACRMINQKTIPAIIYPKPDPVKNIVYMFNIHRFRKDWDPLPTAMKLEELKQLVADREGTPPTEAQLAALTGMSRGQIRRCTLIMEIPVAERRQLLAELEKPEHERRITTDLYIECQRGVRTIGNHIPRLSYLERPVRDAVIKKYKTGVIVNLVHMRLIAKIARAVTRGVPDTVIERALVSLVEDRHATLEDAYNRVAWVYDIRSLQIQAQSLASLMEALPSKGAHMDDETRQMLRALQGQIRRLLT